MSEHGGISTQSEERSRASQPPLIRWLRTACKKSASRGHPICKRVQVSRRNLALTWLAERRVGCKAGTTQKQTPDSSGFMLSEACMLDSLGLRAGCQLRGGELRRLDFRFGSGTVVGLAMWEPHHPCRGRRARATRHSCSPNLGACSARARPLLVGGAPAVDRRQFRHTASSPATGTKTA